jgi:hypothetical protein
MVATSKKLMYDKLSLIAKDPGNQRWGLLLKALKKSSFLICGKDVGKQKTHLSDNMINGFLKCRGDPTRTDDH